MKNEGMIGKAMVSNGRFKERHYAGTGQRPVPLSLFDIFQGEYTPVPSPYFNASTGTELSIKPTRVSEAWRFTPVYASEVSS